MKIRTRRAQNKHLVDEPVRRNASTAAQSKPARRGERTKPDSKYFQSNKELRQAFLQRQLIDILVGLREIVGDMGLWTSS